MGSYGIDGKMRNEEGKAVHRESQKEGVGEHDLRDNGFPVDLRVLLVEDSLLQLLILEKMLQSCKYQVTKCQEAANALSILREHETRFDLVISDYDMPGMDGIQLLERVASQMDLPFVIISAYDRMEIVSQGVLSGACDYLIKPVRMESLEIIWQHVLRKRGTALKGIKRPRKAEDDNLLHERKPALSSSADLKVPTNKVNPGSVVERSDVGHHEASGAMAPRKRRLIWTDELHEKFVRAVNNLGHKNAVPQKILECMRKMNVPDDLSRENVASHLQKFRLNIQKIENHSQQMPKKHSASSSISRTMAFEKSPSLGGCSDQCCVINQFPGQYLTTLQATGPLALIDYNSNALPLDCQSTYYSQSTVPQPSFYPLSASSSLEFLLDGGTSTISSPIQKVTPVVSPLLAGDCEYRNDGYMAHHIQSLSGDVYEMNNDARPQSIYDDNLMLYQQLMEFDLC